MGQSLLDALNVRVVGSGERTLVFAHGFGTDQSAWQRILPSFLPYYRVVLFDLVCAGSVNPEYFDFRRYTTLDSYVDDLLHILDALGSSAAPTSATPFLNDGDYHGGFELGEVERVFSAMEANYEAWVSGYAPLAVGADVPAAVREFSRTLFNMRPDISLFVSRTVFNSDLRGVLGLVKVPCCIIQTARDVSVPASVAVYLKSHLGGRNTVEMLPTEGHLPHLSVPPMLASVIR
ncbi:hypothetical protein C3L33_10854, partial [Rhododendron williamsianum]